MKERYAATKLIVGGEFHMLTRQETVVGDVVVSPHDPFREAGRTGSILHIDNVVAIYSRFGSL